MRPSIRVTMRSLGHWRTLISQEGTLWLLQVLMNKIRDIDSSLIDQNEKSLCYTLLFGKENMNDSENTHILEVTIE